MIYASWLRPYVWFKVKFSSPQQDSDSVSLSGQMGSGASNSTDDLQEIGLPANTHELLTKTISDQLSAKVCGY